MMNSFAFVRNYPLMPNPLAQELSRTEKLPWKNEILLNQLVMLDFLVEVQNLSQCGPKTNKRK